MGNCAGVFCQCVDDSQIIKKVDKDNMQKALAAIREMNEVQLNAASDQSNHFNGGSIQ